MYHHFRQTEAMLPRLRGAFSRKRTFGWLGTHVLGTIRGRDGLGVSSTVRAPGLSAKSYDSLMNLFRSSA